MDEARDLHRRIRNSDGRKPTGEISNEFNFILGAVAASTMIATSKLVYNIGSYMYKRYHGIDSSSQTRSSISDLHHLDLTATQNNTALHPRSTPGLNKHAESDDEEAPHIFQVVLTGGPCAGKSSCQKYFAQKLRGLGFDVYLVPEVPTMLQNAGCQYPGLDGGDRLITFETSLIELQLQMEQTFFSIAQSTKRKSVIIFDRGLLDVAAFLPPETWSQVLNHNQWLKEGFLSVIDRYDLIIHLVTAAQGAEKVFETLDRPKKETIDEARRLDQKIRACWRGHPHHRVVDNSAPSFEGKLERACEHLLELVLNHKLL